MTGPPAISGTYHTKVVLFTNIYIWQCAARQEPKCLGLQNPTKVSPLEDLLGKLISQIMF